MFKNIASQKLVVFAFDSTTNAPETGDAANITAYVSKDYGAVTVLTDTSATEMDATNAKGYYLFDLTQAETNGDCLMFSAKSATSNIVVIGVPATVFTVPANFTAASIDGNGRVDVIKLAGTTCTARDIGASVLISSGTGTGQLDVTSGVIKANLAQILGTVLTETAGYLAAGFKQFFNIATPTSTMNTITAVTTATNLTTNNDKTGYSLSQSFPTNFSSLSIDVSGRVDVAKIAGTAQTARDIGASVLLSSGTGTGQVSLSSGLVTATLSGDLTSTMKTSVENSVWDAAMSSHLTSGTTGASLNGAGSAGDPWTTSLPGSYTSGQAGYIVGNNINASVSSRLASASYTAPDNTSITAIKSKTDNLPASPAATGDIPTAAQNATAVLTTQMTESYAADGVAPTLTQAVLMTQQHLGESGISGTTKTVKKLDGSTSAATFTLDDATTPTSITRSA